MGRGDVTGVTGCRAEHVQDAADDVDSSIWSIGLTQYRRLPTEI
jgi:hypothetical protein